MNDTPTAVLMPKIARRVVDIPNNHWDEEPTE